MNTNTSPTADAGTDQSVAGGDLVALDGSGSSDPDGDILSFMWAQTTGTSVALSGANTANPTFTAPNVTETLSFQLTVTDGNGGSDSDVMNVSVTAQVGNLPPTASAGNNQTVSPGTTVTLNGNGSSDPNGDVLSFSWTQSSGTAVSLSGANTAIATFTAPNSAGTMTFDLTVDDGNGGTDTDSVSVTVASSPTLYIANLTGHNVVGYDLSDPNSVNGNIPPDANLQGAQTLLFGPTDIVIDAGGSLLTTNLVVPSRITGHADAANLASINGNVAPTRNVEGAATLLDQPTSLAVNTANDLVFAADVGAVDRILVYNNASTNAFNGNLAPIRTIESADLQTPFGINFGASDNLYVANRGGSNVLVFANASTLNGNVTPTRIIESAAFTDVFDVLVDSNDTMYVVNGAGGGNTIAIFNNASILNGVVAPDFVLQVQGAVNITAIAVDSFGTGYIVDVNNNAMYSYDNIATLNGVLLPDRTLQGAQTQLLGPIRVFLLE